MASNITSEKITTKTKKDEKITLPIGTLVCGTASPPKFQLGSACTRNSASTPSMRRNIGTRTIQQQQQQNENNNENENENKPIATTNTTSNSNSSNKFGIVLNHNNNQNKLSSGSSSCNSNSNNTHRLYKNKV